MPAKRQKPSDQLHGKGSRFRGTSPLALVPPDASRPVPSMPKGLPRHLQAVWRDFWRDPVSQQLTPADGYDVARYFTLLAEREEVETKARANPLVPGSLDNKVLNPLYKRANDLTREIEKYREQLGILPLSRVRLNVTTTQLFANVATLKRQRSTAPAEPAGVIDLDDLA